MTKLITKWFIPILAFLFVTNGLFYAARADHDDHQKRRRKSRHDDHHVSATKLNPIYLEKCGDCHFAYPPLLLPCESWNKILSSLENHFGEELEVDIKSKEQIIEYLEENSAQQGSKKISRKIMRSLGNEKPLRITDVPYIKKQHYEISKEVLGRNSIGSLSNCAACHTAAEKGYFDDDDVVIPK